MGAAEAKQAILDNRTALGIEFGSTRIKAVLVDGNNAPIASGGHEWENRYENGVWTYSLEDIWSGLQDCYQQMAKDVVSYMKNCHPNYDGSFKVYTRRAKKSYPITSMEVSAELGGRILDEFPDASVDVHEPDLTLSVEIRDKIYVYSQTIKGAGGMPIGTNGKAMLLLSGGIDSPVAGYMIAKRGVKIDAVYFHAPPYTSERAKQKVVDLAKQVAKYSGPIRLHVVNFTDIQFYIYDQCPHDELTIIMRRYMMRIAEHFAKESRCLGLITGESIGQVASQTLQSLAATNEVCTLPVYRPVIGFDKQEIVERSWEIGTYETSIQPFEDCCTIFVLSLIHI